MVKNYEESVTVFKALSDDNRLLILSLLSKEELCACNLLKRMSITQSTLSHHMKILCDCHLVFGRKHGKCINYSINKDRMKQLCESISVLSESRY